MNRLQDAEINNRSIKQFLIKYGISLVILILIVLFSFSNPEFLTIKNFLLMFRQLAPFGIAVIGMTFVLLTGGIDISIGRIMFVSCVIVGEVIRALPKSILASPMLYVICLAIVVVIGGVIGFTNGFLVTRLNVHPFLVTLLTGYIARGIGLSIAGANKYDMSAIAGVANGTIFGGVPVVMVIFLVFALVMQYVLKNTRFGKFTMAIGNNRVAASQVGINVNRQLISVYIICSISAAIGGLFSAGQISEVFTTFGETNEFQIISATVIGGVSLFGGKGSVLPGAFIGVLLVQIVLNGLSMLNASVYMFNIVRGMIIFIAVMMDSINNKGELR